MRIEIVSDDSIGPQTRTYAEYRLFAALSQALDTDRVRSASLELRRAGSKRHIERVSCTLTIESNSGEVTRLRASGGHPYAAINRAVERLRVRVRDLSPIRSMKATERCGDTASSPA